MGSQRVRHDWVTSLWLVLVDSLWLCSLNLSRSSERQTTSQDHRWIRDTRRMPVRGSGRGEAGEGWESIRLQFRADPCEGEREGRKEGGRGKGGRKKSLCSAFLRKFSKASVESFWAKITCPRRLLSPSNGPALVFQSHSALARNNLWKLRPRHKYDSEFQVEHMEQLFNNILCSRRPEGHIFMATALFLIPLRGSNFLFTYSWGTVKWA